MGEVERMSFAEDSHPKLKDDSILFTVLKIDKRHINEFLHDIIIKNKLNRGEMVQIEDTPPLYIGSHAIDHTEKTYSFAIYNDKNEQLETFEYSERSNSTIFKQFIRKILDIFRENVSATSSKQIDKTFRNFDDFLKSNDITIMKILYHPHYPGLGYMTPIEYILNTGIIYIEDNTHRREREFITDLSNITCDMIMVCIKNGEKWKYTDKAFFIPNMEEIIDPKTRIKTSNLILSDLREFPVLRGTSFIETFIKNVDTLVKSKQNTSTSAAAASSEERLYKFEAPSIPAAASIPTGSSAAASVPTGSSAACDPNKTSCVISRRGGRRRSTRRNRRSTRRNRSRKH